MADSEYTKQTITNVTDGPKVVNGRPAGVLAAGGSVEVEMTKAEIASAKASEWFAFGAAAAKAAKADEADAAE